MAVAEITIIPMTKGEMRPFVDAAVDVFRHSGLKYEVDAMGTSLEGNVDQIIEAARAAHRAALERGADRVITEIRIDEEPSEELTLDHELMGYR